MAKAESGKRVSAQDSQYSAEVHAGLFVLCPVVLLEFPLISACSCSFPKFCLALSPGQRNSAGGGGGGGRVGFFYII